MFINAELLFIPTKDCMFDHNPPKVICWVEKTQFKFFRNHKQKKYPIPPIQQQLIISFVLMIMSTNYSEDSLPNQVQYVQCERYTQRNKLKVTSKNVHIIKIQ